MKKLLVLTDFSAIATHAAEYAYTMAKHMNADIILCNAVIVAADIPRAGLAAWPLEERDTFVQNSDEEIKLLKIHLEKYDHTGNYKPAVTFVNDPGTLTNVLNDTLKESQIDLVVMGAHGGDGNNIFLLDDHCMNMIKNIHKPLLLIPPTANFSPFKKIAFVTDFKNPDDDLPFIYMLIVLAKQLNAEILLTHIHDGKYQSPAFEHWIKNFLVELADTANYPHIYYKMVKSRNTESGLDWVSEHGEVDLLAMVHRQHGFLDNLLHGSDTKKMAGQLTIPLLVFQD